MIQRILVAVDDSEASLAAVDQAIRLARPCRAQLRLVHLLDEARPAPAFACYGAWSEEVFQLMREAGRRVLETCRARVVAAGLPAETLLVEGFGVSVADVIAEKARAWHADLIVMGTQGRSGLELLLHGSDAQRLIRTAPVPVMSVRALPRRAPDGSAATRPREPALLAAFAEE